MAVSYEDYKKQHEVKMKRHQQVREHFIKQYPNLFLGIDDYSIDVPDGWIPLVETLCEELYQFPVTCVQVKQKMAGLRFYVDLSSTSSSDQSLEVQTLINFAEKLSKRICEWCGIMNDTVDVFGNGYISRSCENCKNRILEDSKKYNED